ncbi:MAG TPA: dockerin type I domain-containing protein, partial [Bacteroidales bacterium]|nr:dockerin type I domain-containing protein [Bacteroidales bacterium]
FYPYPSAFAGNDTSGCTYANITLSGSATGLSQAQPTDIVIGSGTNYTTDIVATPFKTYFMDGRTQMMYTREELHAAGFDAGPITAIGFRVSTPGSIPMQNFSIHMTTTGVSNISGFQVMGPLVYYSQSYQAVAGWNMFALINPFFWDGTSNIIVEVCFDNSTFTTNSSMEFSTVSGKVWGMGCDNCASGCALTGGSPSNYRANLRIIGENDPSTYWWTGPLAYYANYKLAQINNLQAANGGVYTFHVDNGWGCTATDQLTLSILPTPVVDAGPADTILEGNATVLQALVSGGASPYSYSWTPTTGLSNPGILNPQAAPIATQTYTLEAIGANGCSSTDNVRILVLQVHDLTGRLYYDNSMATGIANAEVYLSQSGHGIIDTAYTGNDGGYSFRAPVGIYSLSTGITKPWGGVNATDALVVARHAVFLTQLQGLRFDAGDVNLNDAVNATDALQIMRRFVGYISTFNAEDWLNDMGGTFHLNGDMTRNIKAICAGDVDGTYVPGKNAANHVRLEVAEGAVLATGPTVEVPVFLKHGGVIGAISLEIILPEGIRQVTGLSSELEGMIYLQQGRVLRIAWQETGGRYLEDDYLLFSLECSLEASVASGSYLSLGQANEFADADALVLTDIKLYTQPILGAKDGPMLGKNFPDPFQGITHIPFHLPTEAQIVLELHDVLGRPVATLAEGQYAPGNHLVDFDGSHYPSGMYYYTLKVSGSLGYTATHKMIISR